jgi:hypothetical protein
MKTIYIFLLLVFCQINIIAQNQGFVQARIVTDPETGCTVEYQGAKTITAQHVETIAGGSETLNINWQFTDPVAVGSKTVVSEAGTTFNSWWLNNERVSLYGDNATPLWESAVPTEWEYPVDMAPDGAFLTVAFDSVVQVFASTSQIPVWERIVDGDFIGVKISESGDKVFTVENMPDGKSIVSACLVGQSDPVWETVFDGPATTFAASGDRSTLVMCQYVGYNTLWVLDAADGSVIYNTSYKNQYPPALSYDGKVILNGDYNGYAFLYVYDDEQESYAEKWNFKVGGGGTSAWVLGMGVSADGSTAGVGTLVFLPGGSYDGEIYLFDTGSNVPLWVFEHCGDEICSIDLTNDGSLMAAAGYGPMDHSKPDFYLFRRQSNDPIYTLSTQGSFFATDISADGTLCSVTGKAVHARIMGSGGLLYNIDSNPGGGAVAGTITDENGAAVDHVKVEVEGIEDYFDHSDAGGNYEIKYIPAASYQIEATKVGYYPFSVSGVEIIEGETITLNFALEATEFPPELITVSHGSDYSVHLEWDCGVSGEGFNIYRKSDPEGLFPEVPLATVDAEIFNYVDENVFPLRTYYYAVTRIIEPGIESPYSNVQEGWMASGFVIDNISVYHGETPVIDGTISPGEWDDAFRMDASDFFGTYDNTPNPVGSVTMFFKVNQEMTELYVACINENDTVMEDHDEVALYIDDNNDGTYPEQGDDSEGNYWAAHYASGNQLKYRPIYGNGGVGTVIYLENPQLEVSDETGHLVYEFMIPMGEDEVWKISPNEENQSGLFTFTLDDPTSFDGYWPSLNQQIFVPTDYGDITFGTDNEVPVPPADVSLTVLSYNNEVMANIEWSQPSMNDFDHFNVYYDAGNGFELLNNTIGTQLFYSASTPAITSFYITTVDQSGQESVPSETVVFDPWTNVDEPLMQSCLSVYPNPASGMATISFRLENTAPTKVMIFNLQGKLVAELMNGELPAGDYSVIWNGTNAAGDHLPDGIYFVRVINPQTLLSGKLILLR